MQEKVEHPLFARFYLRMAKGRTASREDEYRRRLLAGLSGRVIEVGAGSGLNFSLYPDGVEQVLAVEPEPLLREEATKAARDAAVPVEVVDGVSGRLPTADESFDAGVASLVLCSVPDQARALAEFRRVLRPRWRAALLRARRRRAFSPGRAAARRRRDVLAPCRRRLPRCA